MALKKRPNAWFGYVPDVPDFRDYKFDHRAALGPRVTLPTIRDLRAQCPAILNQGALGSCTANAIGSAVEFDRMKQHIRDWTPSRLFIYYNERAMEGTIREDAGAMIRDGIKSVNKVGAPPESYWPYIIGKFARKPTARAYASAAKHPSLTYRRVEQTWDALRAAIAIEEVLIVFGFAVYESFDSAEVERTGIAPMPAKSEQMLGGHAVCMVGYDETKDVVICRNSWGPSWGQKGYFTLPREYVLNDDLAADFWLINTVK